MKRPAGEAPTGIWPATATVSRIQRLYTGCTFARSDIPPTTGSSRG